MLGMDDPARYVLARLANAYGGIQYGGQLYSVEQHQIGHQGYAYLFTKR